MRKWSKAGDGDSKRGGSTEDVANACLFFASDMSAYVGQSFLNVCGGMLT
jgi:3-oxoacyl-[acyl-carrier protein] reductase